MRQLRQSQILNDESVHTGLGNGTQLRFGGLQLAGEDERVHGHESLHSVEVEKLHELGQVLVGEIVGTQPRIELRQPEVNRIRTRHHCRAGAIPIAGGGEEFGAQGSVLHHLYSTMPRADFGRPILLLIILVAATTENNGVGLALQEVCDGLE